MKKSSCYSRTPLLQALIDVFELEEDDNVPDDEHFIEVEDQPSYSAAYSQLANAGKATRDPFSGTIQNPKIYLAQSLQKLCAAHPGQVRDRQVEVKFQVYLFHINIKNNFILFLQPIRVDYKIF